MKFRKGKEQSGLFDLIERVEELSRRAGPLDKLNEQIDFEFFRSKLLEILGYGDHEKGQEKRGQRSYFIFVNRPANSQPDSDSR